MTMGLLGGIGLLACAIAIYGVINSAAKGNLPRNGGAGIRTVGTRSSDEAWLAGHRAALPTARLVGLICGALAVLLVIAGAMDGKPDPTVTIVVLFVLGYGIMLGGAFYLARVADRAARETLGPSGSN
ncbi:SdpI family protein [Flexivirga meconopsidis]|uniref:SdpI family protein n=1 Tax=Flexivirga meconopsidis TaxID=2977121 RepID=UPI00224015D4|nr:SdpI family protein [Flexivirga meconopsidis]